jgi:hypothetical protein
LSNFTQDITMKIQTGSVQLSITNQAGNNLLEINGNIYFGVIPLVPYSFGVTNISSVKILVVPSVDGRSVLQDKEAEVSDRGMILAPRQSYNFTGFRFDDNTVGEFLPNEQLSQTISALSGGDMSKIGCIGIAIFREKVSYQEPVYRSTYRTHLISFT